MKAGATEITFFQSILSIIIKLKSGPFPPLVRSGESLIGVVKSDFVKLFRLSVQQDVKLSSVISQLKKCCLFEKAE